MEKSGCWARSESGMRTRVSRASSMDTNPQCCYMSYARLCLVNTAHVWLRPDPSRKVLGEGCLAGLS